MVPHTGIRISIFGFRDGTRRSAMAREPAVPTPVLVRPMVATPADGTTGGTVRPVVTDVVTLATPSLGAGFAGVAGGATPAGVSFSPVGRGTADFAPHPALSRMMARGRGTTILAGVPNPVPGTVALDEVPPAVTAPVVVVGVRRVPELITLLTAVPLAGVGTVTEVTGVGIILVVHAVA